MILTCARTQKLVKIHNSNQEAKEKSKFHISKLNTSLKIMKLKIIMLGCGFGGGWGLNGKFMQVTPCGRGILKQKSSRSVFFDRKKKIFLNSAIVFKINLGCLEFIKDSNGLAMAQS